MTGCLSGKQGQQTAQLLPLMSQLRKQSAFQCSILSSPEHMYRYSVLSSLLHHLPSDPSQLFIAATTPLELPSYWRSIKCFFPFLHCPIFSSYLPSPYTVVVTSKSCPSLWDSKIQTSWHTIRTGSKHNWTTHLLY